MKDYHKQLAESFRIYTDFECNMKRVKSSSDSGDNASCTEKYQYHISCSFSYKLVCTDDKFNKSVILCRGKKRNL